MQGDCLAVAANDFNGIFTPNEFYAVVQSHREFGPPDPLDFILYSIGSFPLMISRLRTVSHIGGFLIFLYSPTLLFPILIGLVFGEDNLHSFILTFVIAMTLGLITWLGTLQPETNRASIR